MAIEQSQRLKQIVRVAEVRKQRLANAATEARRKLAAAEEDRIGAVQRLHAAKAQLHDAGKVLLQNPASDQILIWRNHCSALKDERITEKAQSEDRCAEAESLLSQSLHALNRQDLRHDHLAGQMKQARQRHVRLQEARLDDEAQGCGRPGGAALP